MVFYIKENEGVSVFLNLKLDYLNKSWSFSVDGKYGDWSEFNKCSVSCGGGTQRKTRACNNPTPAFGGRTCEGPSVVTQSCNTHHCPGILLRLFKYCSFLYTLPWYFERFYTVNILTLQRCCSEFCILFLIWQKP